MTKISTYSVKGKFSVGQVFKKGTKTILISGVYYYKSANSESDYRNTSMIQFQFYNSPVDSPDVYYFEEEKLVSLDKFVQGYSTYLLKEEREYLCATILEDNEREYSECLRKDGRMFISYSKGKDGLYR